MIFVLRNSLRAQLPADSIRHSTCDAERSTSWMQNFNLSNEVYRRRLESFCDLFVLARAGMTMHNHSEQSLSKYLFKTMKLKRASKDKKLPAYLSFGSFSIGRGSNKTGNAECLRCFVRKMFSYKAKSCITSKDSIWTLCVDVVSRVGSFRRVSHQVISYWEVSTLFFCFHKPT